jgi:preprotein translocase subunit SecG
MYTVFIVLHIIIAASLITLVLLQQGKGADAGSGFGAGASSTVFGSRGSGSFLSRITAMLATGFFLTSLILAYFATQVQGPASIIERSPAPVIEQPVGEVPAQPSDLPAVPPQAPEDVPQAPSQQ